jgi:class 3 adenylate cyclase/pimeloyl-ACP methyl ester carboxylesterase
MAREVRYCTTSDGVRIAYCAEGEGPAILVCPFFVESFSLTHLLPEYEGIMQRLGRGRRLVRYDMRGTGLSEREVSDFSIGALTRDIEAVATAAPVDGFILYGWGASGARAIAYAAEHPEKVTALVLYSTFARPTDVMSREQAVAFAQLAATNWHIAAQSLADLSGRAEYADVNLRGARLTEQSATGEMAGRMMVAGQDGGGDVSRMLPRVTMPTLIIQWRETQLFTPASAQTIAAGIPNSRLVMLEGSTNWLGENSASAIGDEVDEFLEPGSRPAKLENAAERVGSSSGMAVIMFADIVDSTAMTERIGDAAFRERARTLDEAMRQAIVGSGGTAIDGKLLGDGVLAVFTSARQAIDAAALCREASSSMGLQLHLGVHAGDVIREDGNVFGGAVNIASRICGLCEPGQILVSDIVRGLARTSAGVTFEDRGEHALKGIQEPVRLYAVSSP